MESAYHIAITGGPGGGKSDLLPRLKAFLETHGFRVFLVQERATELYESGISILPEDWNPPRLCSKHILRYQLVSEDLRKAMVADLVRDPDAKVVFLYDRAAPEGEAYAWRDEFAQVLHEEGLTLEGLQQRYDLVIHMVTTADGAEAHFSAANNPARSEAKKDPAFSRALDRRTREAWRGHPNFFVIDNRTGWDEKVERALWVVSRMLHLPAPVERERRFIIRNFDFPGPIPGHILVCGIEQWYLLSQAGVVRRARSRTFVRGGELVGYDCWYAEKSDTGVPGENAEREEEVSIERFNELLRDHDRASLPVRKVRHGFGFGEHYLEVDVFGGHLAGIVIVEAEVRNLSDPVALPPEWDVIEVTGDSRWSNYALSRGRPEAA